MRGWRDAVPHSESGLPEQLPRRMTQLLVGIFLLGIGIAVVVRSALGAAPWDVLAQGMTHHIPLSFGTISVVISGVVLLFWIPLRQKPGFGSMVNAVMVGPSADIGFAIIPDIDPLWLRMLGTGSGIVLTGLATGLYIGSRLGSGPRDGLMTGLHGITGQPIWVVRLAIELVVVTIGWMLGGTVGIGTVVFATLIGPACQYFMRVCYVPLSTDGEPNVVASVDGSLPGDSVMEVPA